MPVIGLTGPNASGKGEVAAYLAEKGFRAYSLSDIIREELAAQGLAPTRETMIDTGTRLRRDHGPGVLAERLVDRLGDRDVVDSIRNPSEVFALRRVPGFVLVHVDAPPALRFERSIARGRPGDAESLERFVELEARENTSDPAAQQLLATASLADVTLVNDGDIPALRGAVDRILTECGAADSRVEEAAELLRGAERVVAITGAGVSAESGVETFRSAGGIWERYDLEAVATADALARDPAHVWAFLLELRRRYVDARPNPAHGILAAWDARFASMRVITQNIDRLHTVAGSRQVLEIHGNAATARHEATGRIVDIDDLDVSTLPPMDPESGDRLRPNVVYFGEAYDARVIDTAESWIDDAQVVLVLGTSGVVPTPYLLAERARAHGAWIIDVNPDPSDDARAIAHVSVPLRATAALRAIDAALSS